MTHLNLTLAIVLSVGAVGCGGLATQSSGSLTAVHDSARGVDGLWEAPSNSSGAAGVAGTLGRADRRASRADLWIPAPAQRGREAQTKRRASGGLYVSDGSSGMAF